ncbi:MAG: hypothetical protein APF77_00915 [Clostridia bacterium BRH_c25]|nr:MAG: hypothetical protein APF77_00915 [Clostridia bacterium BRH_c25]
MIKYILKRILMMIPVILGISFILFSIMSFTPGDPARLILGEDARVEDVQAKREELGLNDNFFIRYGRYVVDAVRGDFGKSYRTNIPVFDEIFSRFPTTVKLALLGVALSTLIGVPIGIISAVKQYTIIDGISLVSALLLASMPGFFVGMLLIMLFSLKLDLLPATGIETWKHYIMPAFSIAAVTMATLIRMTRSTMLEEIRQDYVRTAKAKGASGRRVIFKHALRNALLPVVTVIGINIGIQIAGTIMIEAVFAIPGLGTLMINSIRMKDTPVVMASILFVALIAGLVNLAVDIIYTFIDPRVKSQYVMLKR